MEPPQDASEQTHGDGGVGWRVFKQLVGKDSDPTFQRLAQIFGRPTNGT